MYTALIVNLNGSASRELTDQQEKVADAAYDLITALCEAAPRGRDYQISPAGDYDAARVEHIQTVHAITACRERAVDIAMAIMDQTR